ncbi:MAG TPA: TaqI-like C-terminal specificity domain-containing protein [Terriglobia bacterium]|nr:TaqI-like C-terminal specificity domain-containing protein [Terriglobia bacterium]
MSTPAFEEAFEKVSRLAATFQANERHYQSPDYQEAEARKDFIDKFFIALGWDVNHDRQTNPYEQEVKVEPSVQAGGQRRADYAFHIAPTYREVRFFVEAKKPYGDIATAENYFQTIRYGWNSETPLAVLTDFSQFHVLDCRFKPDLDTASNRCIAKYHYSEYTDRKKFAEIYWLFSREAVADRSLEKRTKELPKPRGKAVQRGLFPGGYQNIDESFLKELDEYRNALARAFKNENRALNSETLTELTQRALDRLVFLRFLEDKGIEPQRLVDKFGEKGTAWEDFIAASRRLDSIYNGIVFKRHDILDDGGFQVDDNAFANICESLAHVNSPYDFNYIPIHILGSIYERFLGNVIVATDKRVRVEPKPEVRKAGGVYYTPEYIVRYIVENTVGKLIAGKTPDQIAEMRFADIACGSGSFLLGVFDLLLAYHGHYYNGNPKKARRGDCINREGRLYLSLGKKREILLNNIYGVDIDAQAVEVCQLSLFLKLLQEETEASTHQYLLDFAHIAQMKKLLPDLSKNIVCGNSLIGRDINGDLFGEERKLNPMDFEDAFPEVMKRGGFDCVLGNPPYGMVTDSMQKAYFGNHFAATEGRFDTFGLFLERATKLSPMGLVGYILPSPLLSNLYARRLRRYMLDHCSVEEITNFGYDVFADPTVHTCIIILESMRRPNVSVKVRKQVRVQDALHEAYDYEIPQDKLGANPNSVLDIFFDPQASILLNKLSFVGQPLGENYFIRQCIKTGNDNKYVKCSATSPGLQWQPSLRGKSVERYFTREKALFVKYGSWLARNWANKSFYETPKIAIRETGSRIAATLDLENRYFLSSLYAVYPKSPSERPALRYLLGILNSSVASYFVKKVALELTKGAFTKLRTNQLARLPIPRIDFSQTAVKRKHDEIVAKVDAMLKAKTQLAKAKTDKDKAYYENKCAALDRQINRLVYDLYGLTDEEIQIIEQQPG